MTNAVSRTLTGFLFFLGTMGCWTKPSAFAGSELQACHLTAHEFQTHSAELTVPLGLNKLLRAKADIYRVSVVDSSICDVIQVSSKEVLVVGKKEGSTHVRLWIRSQRSFIMLVRVETQSAQE